MSLFPRTRTCHHFPCLLPPPLLHSPLSELAQTRRAHQTDVVSSAEDAAAIAKKLKAELQQVASEAEVDKARALAQLEARLMQEHEDKMRYGAVGSPCV
jgi:hypothetical protein